MTLLTEKGTFTKTTSTSTPVSQQVNLSNGSLTPKIIILWTTGQTTINGTYTDDNLFSYGFSDGTNNACQYYRMDESREQEAYIFYDNRIIALTDDSATQTIISEGAISATAAGSFTVNWSTQSDTNAIHIHYTVIGGSDITNVQVVNTTVQNTSTGSHSWNGTGTSFQPDFCLTMTGADGYTTVNTKAVGNDRSTISVGAVDSTGSEWVVSGRDETVGTSDCDMYFNNAACLANHDSASGAIDYLADFVSFNNSDGGGITLNVTNAATNSSQLLAFLFVKGGTWEAGTFQQRDGTGTQTVTLSNSALTPLLTSLQGINSATAGSLVANFYLGFGATDGTNEDCSWFGNTNNLGTFESARAGSNTKVYRQATPAATASSSTTNAECDMNDMTTVGQFTLDWTTADSTLRRMAYWVVGEGSVVPSVVDDSRRISLSTIPRRDEALADFTSVDFAGNVSTHVRTIIAANSSLRDSLHALRWYGSQLLHGPYSRLDKVLSRRHRHVSTFRNRRMLGMIDQMLPKGAHRTSQQTLPFQKLRHF